MGRSRAAANDDGALVAAMESAVVAAEDVTFSDSLARL